MVVQGAEKGVMPGHGELVAKLMSVGESQNKWSEAFTKSMSGYAEDLAKQLERPEVIQEFTNTHKVRLMANVEDALQPAKTMTTEIFDSLFNAWRANNEAVNSTADRLDLIRSYFNQFAYAADIFNQANGPAAEAVFKAAAMMFVKDGKVTDVVKGGILPIDAEEWAMFRENVNNYFKSVNPHEAAPAGREHLPFPTDAKKAAAQIDLTSAEIAYAFLSSVSLGLQTKRWM